jgi:hypothetical protein
MVSRTSPSEYPTENRLRAELLNLIKKQGFVLNSSNLVKEVSYSKEKIREVHSYSRFEKLEQERSFIDKWMPKIFKYFASSSDVDPNKIEPHPIIVENNEEYSALFRIASLWWSIPVSKGFGRRFRILIFDKANGKLFGLLALTDPVFNLQTRDAWIGWDVRTREKNLIHILDANVLGAVPPYNQLLGAKFIGLLAASDFTRDIFRKRYRNKSSVIYGRNFDGRLALISATSALGKSSIYNRLRFDNVDVFSQIGYTRGYGHFHLANGTYEKLRQYLRFIGDPVVTRFKYGSGPNYRFRVVRTALEHLQLPADLLRHGVRRGVYLAPLAANAAAFLRNDAKRLRWYHRPLGLIVEYWRERWLLPRASRTTAYDNFNKDTWWDILGQDRTSKSH